MVTCEIYRYLSFGFTVINYEPVEIGMGNTVRKCIIKRISKYLDYGLDDRGTGFDSREAKISLSGQAGFGVEIENA
jgi:hypothetical protein